MTTCNRLFAAVTLSLVFTTACAGCSRPAPIQQTVDIDFGRASPRSPRVQTSIPESLPVEPDVDFKEPAATNQIEFQDESDVSRSSAEESDSQNEYGSGAEGLGDSSNRFSESELPVKESDSTGRASPGTGARPAFPGRQPRRTAMTAVNALAAAKRLLNTARAAVGRGDVDAACRDALSAYEIIAAHEKANSECAKLMKDAERLLDAIGRRQLMIENVPTRFE